MFYVSRVTDICMLDLDCKSMDELLISKQGQNGSEQLTISTKGPIPVRKQIYYVFQKSASVSEPYANQNEYGMSQ